MNVIEDVEVQCPYCGEVFAVAIETTQGNHTTTEDCAVCCHPIALRVECRPGEVLGIAATIG